MIIINSSNIKFKNPQIGKPTRAIKDHYFGRNIQATVDGEDRMFRFKKDEIPFDADEDLMIELISNRLFDESESN